MSDHQGMCRLCDKSYTARGMKRHLKSCIDKQATSDATTKYYYIIVKDRLCDDFWLHLLVDKKATFRLLDDFFRGIWLECCGHLSEFIISDYRFVSNNPSSFGGRWHEYDMDVQMKKLFNSASKFSYVYDFGSSTELVGEIVGEVDYDHQEAPLLVLARNHKPSWSDGNSPRSGVCGYEENKSYTWENLRMSDYSISKDNHHIHTHEVKLKHEKVDTQYTDKVLREMASLLRKNLKTYKSSIPTHVPETFDGMCDLLKMDDLRNMAQSFGMAKYNKLKKAELIQCLKREIPLLYPLKLRMLNSEQLAAIKRLVTGGGALSVDELFDDRYTESKASAALIHMSLFTTSVRTIHIGDSKCYLPVEIENELQDISWQELDITVKRNDRIISLTKGLLYYYGYFELSALSKEIETIIEHQLPTGLLQELLEVSNDWDYSFDWFGSYILHRGLDRDPERLQSIIDESAVRRDIKRKVVSENELIMASNELYYEKNKTTRLFATFLSKAYGISKEEIETTIVSVFDSFDYGDDIGETVEYLSSFIELPNLDVMNEVTGYLVNMYNHHRQWMLKGHTPSEIGKLDDVHKTNETVIQAVDFKRKVKIGRNDPCPCGSGRKYKHCCG